MSEFLRYVLYELKNSLVLVFLAGVLAAAGLAVAFIVHIPVIKQDGNKVVVEIGSVEHPMVEAHYIEWIVLETEKGTQSKKLNPGEEPKAEFVLADDDKVVAAYEYCNLHGFWKAE